MPVEYDTDGLEMTCISLLAGVIPYPYTSKWLYEPAQQLEIHQRSMRQKSAV